MDDIVFNLDIPYDDESPTPLGELFWEKYEACLEAMRVSCSDDELFHGFRITNNNPNPPLANLVFELPYDNNVLIIISIKYERSSVYFIAWRRGRGDPNPNDNEPWRQCNDFSHPIPGFVPANFNGRYEGGGTANNFGIGEIGVRRLRQSVINLWFNTDVENSFRALCVLVAEPVRYEFIAHEIRNVVSADVVGEVFFSTMIKELIKSWRVVSKAIQEHLTSKDENHKFVIPKPYLQHLTFDEARSIIAILKRCGVADED